MVPPASVVVVAESQSVNLTCRTTGKPDPQITWFKENRQITGGRYRTLINGDLHIEVLFLISFDKYIDIYEVSENKKILNKKCFEIILN